MRIVFDNERLYVPFLIVIGLGTILSSTSTFAAPTTRFSDQASTSANASQTDTSPSPTPGQVSPQPAAQQPSVQISSPTITAEGSASTNTMPPQPPTPAQLASTQPLSDGKGVSLDDATGKMPSTIKGIIKHLDNDVENVTISDLNTARQAIAKVEILIELEKKMAELEKIKQERESKSMAASLPMSALSPTPMRAMLPGQTAGQMLPPPDFGMSSSRPELVRVIGTTGKYRAIFKTGSDTEKTVEAGETLSDGEVVLSITPTSVTLERHGNKQVIHIKNVDKVFGGSL